MKTDDIKIIPKWRKSKDEIWNEVFSEIDCMEARPKIVRLTFWKYAAAAAIALIVSGFSFAYLYTATETAAIGARQFVAFPDGSSANLNAESEIKYKPFWWRFSRTVTLHGEAYFEVGHGNRFTVVSGQNLVRVLGTSFNVFARTEKYSVTCLTGKVEVTTNRENIILTPNMQVTLRNSVMQVVENQSIGWTQNKFSFTDAPLSEVVKEIERQYGIRIVTTSDLNYFYSGNFTKLSDPEEVLQIIGKPFGITFVIK